MAKRGRNIESLLKKKVGFHGMPYQKGYQGGQNDTLLAMLRAKNPHLTKEQFLEIDRDFSPGDTWKGEGSSFLGGKDYDEYNKEQLASQIGSSVPDLAKRERELAADKYEEKESRKALLATGLGGEMDEGLLWDSDRLPDKPFFGKSIEEKYGDIIQEDTEGIGGGYDYEGELEGKLAAGTYKPEVADTPWGAVGKTKSVLEDEGESVLDRIGRENRAKEIAMADFKGEEEGSMWDKFKGLFASDEIKSDEALAQETKDNEALAGKIGAAAKLYSLLQPETPQAAPQIPAAKISRGSVAFPGMKLASQRAKRKYFTPKGLMA